MDQISWAGPPADDAAARRPPDSHDSSVDAPEEIFGGKRPCQRHYPSDKPFMDDQMAALSRRFAHVPDKRRIGDVIEKDQK